MSSGPWRSVLQNFIECGRDAHRAREIGPFKAVRIGRVEAGDALDRRLEVIEAALLHQRGKFGAKARRARRFVNDQAAAGLPDRRLDRLDVERRSEEHTSELQSLMRLSYAVFCLNK